MNKVHKSKECGTIKMEAVIQSASNPIWYGRFSIGYWNESARIPDEVDKYVKKTSKQHGEVPRDLEIHLFKSTIGVPYRPCHKCLYNNKGEIAYTCYDYLCKPLEQTIKKLEEKRKIEKPKLSTTLRGTMTVGDLIMKLEGFDNDLPILTYIEETEEYGKVEKLQFIENNEKSPYSKCGRLQADKRFLLIKGEATI